MTMTHKEALDNAWKAFCSERLLEPRRDLEAAIRAYLDARGLVMVPKKETDEMARAANMARMNVIGGYDGPTPWQAAIAAAPDPFAEGV